MTKCLPALLVGAWMCTGLALTYGADGSTNAYQAGPSGDHRTRLSFHNRLLLNRVVLARLPTIEVMLAVRGAAMPTIVKHVERLAGRVVRSDNAVGYLRVEIPTARFLDLIAPEGINDDIEAYQISSLSQGVWYRDGPPQKAAEQSRDVETQATAAPKAPAASSLPLLSPTQARAAGYTAGEDAGVAAWLEAHPTADGRGVTIAILESGLADFAHPSTRSARSLDGREVRKIVGILNAFDPRSPDTTRVELNVRVQVTKAWMVVGRRTYVFPRPGEYRFGLFLLPAGGNVAHQFGVIVDERSGEIRVDANGNADFSDEPPMSDVNDRVDVRRFTLTHPAPGAIGFVIARGRAPHTVNIYTATSSHQAMTLSVAAGTSTDDSPAVGVAPGAQLLLVPRSNAGARLDDYIETYLEAARRPDVDILCDSSAIQVVPDSAADFVAVMLDRLVARYGKPIFRGAGNRALRLESVSSTGGTFSVGGSLGPKTFAAFYGGATLPALMVHPTGSAGPALDGSIKPDFLAPMHLVSADVNRDPNSVAIPSSAPTARLPPGHQISCCTSASAPYAAGLAALLISRAKQEKVKYSVPTLGRALRLGAAFLSATPAHVQGNGVLDIERAWRELTTAAEPSRITSSAHIVTPLAMYAARGNIGNAIYERDGWFVGRRDTRSLTLRRETGRRDAVVYNVTWTGNDGTFQAPDTVALPLNEPVALPVSIAPAAAGAHSALLNLHDSSTGAIVFRSQATIVAAERFETPDRPLVLAGRVPLMGYRAHYVAIPEGIGALSIDLTVTRGILNTAILRAHGLLSSYYDTVNPAARRAFGPGRYSIAIPRPESGTWAVDLVNDSARRNAAQAPVSTSEAEYTMTFRLLGALLDTRPLGPNRMAIDVTNRAGTLEAPALDVSTGVMRSHRAAFLSTGFPNEFSIDVPANATALTVSVKGERPDTLLELFLYECATGECFSHSLTVPAASSQTIVVQKPRTGRWVAAVNAAPFVPGTGSFVLDEIITSGETQRVTLPAEARRPGDKWSYEVPLGGRTDGPSDTVPVLRLELVDLASARDARANPWADKAAPASDAATVATAIYILKR